MASDVVLMGAWVANSILFSHLCRRVPLLHFSSWLDWNFNGTAILWLDLSPAFLVFTPAYLPLVELWGLLGYLFSAALLHHLCCLCSSTDAQVSLSRRSVYSCSLGSLCLCFSSADPSPSILTCPHPSLPSCTPYNILFLTSGLTVMKNW